MTSTRTSSTDASAPSQTLDSSPLAQPGNGDSPSALLDQVRAWYDADPGREWNRTLSGPYHRLEAEVIHRAILPPLLRPASQILDIGCGPGRHALELAVRGHHVFLADISPACVADARRRLAAAGLDRQLAGWRVCSATDLDAPEGSFDLALLYGPLYHLPGDAARSAVERAASALRPGGHLSAVFLTRTSVIRDLLKRGRFAEARQLLDTGYLEHGLYAPLSARSRGDYMPPAVTSTLAGAVSLIRGAGLEVTDVRSLEGPAAWMRPY
ncbi:MAG: class I SAM-dependent methyltransferase, partial [Trebonia sp.]